jgi:hypothetical protein
MSRPSKFGFLKTYKNSVKKTERRGFPLSNSQLSFSIRLFIAASTLRSAYYAANLVFCLHDANNLLTNTLIGFDYAVSLQLFEFGG